MKILKFAVLSATLLMSISVSAETTIPWTKAGCESVKGTWITAHFSTDSGCDANHCNGKNFCRSNVQMNWFSALIWCHSIGRELTDLETACPNGLASGNTCANLKDKVPNNQITATPSGNKMYAIGYNGARVVEQAKKDSQYALCTE